jgi:hypothetical protein
LFTVTFKNRAIFLGFAVKVLLQAHIFAAFSGVLQNVLKQTCARPGFFLRTSRRDRRFGRTHRLGASGRKHAAMRFAGYDARRRALCAPGRLADAPRRVRPRRCLVCVARLRVARFCADRAVLRFAILAICFSLSLVSGCQRFFLPEANRQ